MKLCLVLVLFVGVVYCRPEGDDLGHLHHFKKNELNSDFQQYKIPSEAGCEAAVETCVQHAHSHAQKCVGLWYSAMGEQIQNCEQNNQEVKAADEAWQKASLTYHKALGLCLKGEDPPAEAEDTEGYFFRKKRSLEHNHAHVEEEYTTHKACWAALRSHRKHCQRQMASCPRIAVCNGYGPEPADGNDKTWYNYVKGLRETKEQKVRDHKRKLHSCLEVEEENLWDNE